MKCYIFEMKHGSNCIFPNPFHLDEIVLLLQQATCHEEKEMCKHNDHESTSILGKREREQPV